MQHIDDVFANGGQKLPSVKGSACGNVQMLASRMRRYDEVDIGRNGIPTNSVRFEWNVCGQAAVDTFAHQFQFGFETIGW